jgi:hypothetical protein
MELSTLSRMAFILLVPLVSTIEDNLLIACAVISLTIYTWPTKHQLSKILIASFVHKFLAYSLVGDEEPFWQWVTTSSLTWGFSEFVYSESFSKWRAREMTFHDAFTEYEALLLSRRPEASVDLGVTVSAAGLAWAWYSGSTLLYNPYGWLKLLLVITLATVTVQHAAINMNPYIPLASDVVQDIGTKGEHEAIYEEQDDDDDETICGDQDNDEDETVRGDQDEDDDDETIRGDQDIDDDETVRGDWYDEDNHDDDDDETIFEFPLKIPEHQGRPSTRRRG